MLGEYDSSGNVIGGNWCGWAHSPVAVLTGTGMSAATYYVNPDNINACRIIITDASGNPVWTWDHYAFGDNAPNQNPSSLGVFPYTFRFPGQYADAESGFSYNMARDYSPGLGRYIQSDQIGLLGGDFSTYGYVKENPLTRVGSDWNTGSRGYSSTAGRAIGSRADDSAYGQHHPVPKDVLPTPE